MVTSGQDVHPNAVVKLFELIRVEHFDCQTEHFDWQAVLKCNPHSFLLLLLIVRLDTQNRRSLEFVFVHSSYYFVCPHSSPSMYMYTVGRGPCVMNLGS